jgi:DNA-binding PadR family transcriptional regulator
LLLKGWVTAEWGASGEQPPGPFYTLTPSGRRQAAAERRDFDRMVLAINRVLDFT